MKYFDWNRNKERFECRICGKLVLDMGFSGHLKIHKKRKEQTKLSEVYKDANR